MGAEILGDLFHLFARLSGQKTKRRLLAFFRRGQMALVHGAHHTGMDEIPQRAQLVLVGVKAKADDGIALDEGSVKIEKSVGLLLQEGGLPVTFVKGSIA